MKNSFICKNNEKLLESYNGMKENSIPLSAISMDSDILMEF